MNIDRKPFLFGIIAGIIIGAMITLPIAMSQGAKIGWSAAEQSTIGLGFELSYAEERARIAEAEIEANRRIVLAWDALTSWYSEESSGGVQANGRRFDENRLTAAHRALPFGTIVIIENTENGRVAVARIEDRGPAEWTGRTLDVSLEVARRLGIVKRGVARLRCYTVAEGRVSEED
jgi:hypothetical protein